MHAHAARIGLVIAWTTYRVRETKHLDVIGDDELKFEAGLSLANETQISQIKTFV